MAIALSPFRALIGFRRHADILEDLGFFPDLAELLDSSGLERTIVFIFQNEDLLIHRIDAYVTHLSEQAQVTPREQLTLELADYYPSDIGLLVQLFMNYVKLKEGEAVALRANLAHAYLEGDIIEAMVSSDNVIRAGFTPKFKDSQLLCEVLDFESEGFEKIQPVDVQGAEVFDAGFKELYVAKVALEHQQEKQITIEAHAVGVALSGKGTVNGEELTQGQTVYLPAGDYTFNSDAELTVYLCVGKC